MLLSRLDWIIGLTLLVLVFLPPLVPRDKLYRFEVLLCAVGCGLAILWLAIKAP